MTPLLSVAGLAQMWSQQYTPDPRLPGIGLAFFLDQLGGRRVVSHAGTLPGFASALKIAPEDGVGVVVLANTATVFGAPLIADTLLRSVLTIPAPSATEAAPMHEAMTGLAGSYAPLPGVLTNFRLRQLLGGRLQIHWDNNQPILHALSLDPQLRRGLPLSRPDGVDSTTFAAVVRGLQVPVVFRRGPQRAVRMCLGYPLLASLLRLPR
jgi:hypothetical protein